MHPNESIRNVENIWGLTKLQAKIYLSLLVLETQPKSQFRKLQALPARCLSDNAYASKAGFS
jgi:hypothetical protein